MSKTEAKSRPAKKSGASKKRRAQSIMEIRAMAVDRFKTLWENNIFKFPFIATVVMIFTSFFMMIVEKDSGMYTSDIDKTLFGRFVSSMYFGIVSLSTSGYGDYTPRTVIGRVYTIFFLSAGVILFSMVTATIAAVLVERKLKEGRGLGDLSKMKNHTIICGWKKNMETVLCDIAARVPDFKSADFVIIANVDPDKAEMIVQQNPCLKDIHFLRGDYFNEVMLRKANVMTARQVFILADESETVTASETDSKSVMTAMTINTLSREVRMCAELLDTKYERYLQNAHVDEIIYSNDYGRLMLANAGAYIGLPSIFNHLLSATTNVRLATLDFPDDFIGKPYAELRTHFKQEYNANLIGLLENVGSYWKHKNEALRDAQKTTDISKLVTNLQKIKTMSSNEPNLHPDDEYVVCGNTKAIVLEREKNEE